MTLRLLRALIPALGLATLLSCASGGYVPAPSMPAARAALRPEYRLFYDALIDYGDWTLIEPYGFVFRPKVDFATFRPYSEGFWAPSDSWGWIWISAEPFGWATYHYGNWFWDRYQGWVWMPGVNWGPAWVDWELAGTFAGWAPRAPQGGLGGSLGAPGGPYLYAPLASMGSTDLKLHFATQNDLGTQAARPQPLTEMVEKDGVRVPFGPSFAKVEQARGGALPRVRLEGSLTSGDEAKVPVPAGIEAARRDGELAAQAARTLIQQKGAPTPGVMRVIRPAWIRPVAASDTLRPKSRLRTTARPDTAR